MTLNDEALDVLFRKARTYSAWVDRPVSDDTLRQVYDLMKWGPTSANSSPARIVFLRTAAAKERLRAALAPSNVEKTMRAPVTAIVAYDLHFYGKMTKLFPHNPGMRDLFANAPGFFPVGHVKSNFVCNLGYGDRTKLHARLPRLTFEEACTLL